MKAVIYTRTSSLTDRQNNDRQVSDLTNYADVNGIDVVKVFNEKISGAKRNEERPVLMACLEFAEADNIDIIYIILETKNKTIEPQKGTL